MNIWNYIGFWDILLIVMVSVQAVLVAYAYEPKWKALIYSMPVPFTFATLALGKPVNATHATGLFLLLGFTYAVWFLRCKLRVPIVVSIIGPAIGYCLAAGILVPVIPKTTSVFCISGISVMLLGALLLKLIPFREEPGYRSPMPLAVKLVFTFIVILIIVLLKNRLQGFMAVFPIVGVIAAYESRFSLWTFSRQTMVMMLTLIPLMMTSKLIQPYFGLGISLILGWIVYWVILIPLTQYMWSAERKILMENENGKLV